MDVTRITPGEYDRLKPFLSHTVAPDVQAQMTARRTQYLFLALAVLRTPARSRAQSLALTHLEESQFRAIQDLAFQGEAQLPPAFEVVE